MRPIAYLAATYTLVIKTASKKHTFKPPVYFLMVP